MFPDVGNHSCSFTLCIYIIPVECKITNFLEHFFANHFDSLAHVTWPAITRHVGTKYTSLLNESYLVTGIEYFHFATCILQSQINCKQMVKIS